MKNARHRNKFGAAALAANSSSTMASVELLEQRDRDVIVFGILRHYWYFKQRTGQDENSCLDEALCKIRQSEGPNSISYGKARKLFEQFNRGIFGVLTELGAEKPSSSKTGLLPAEIAGDGAKMPDAKRSSSKGIASTLPTEIWVDVFSNLMSFPNTFLRLEFVNRHWQAIVTKFFWPNVTHLNAKSGHMRGVELRALAHRFGQQVRHLQFGPSIMVPMRDIICHMQSIQQLQIGIDVKPVDLETIPIYLPQLRRLELTMGNRNYTALPTLLHRCNRLEHFKLCFLGQPQSEKTSRREFDLRISVNSVPSGLKRLEVLECGVFLPHLFELVERDCAESLQVLITGLVFNTIFESMEIAETFVTFKNLRYLQIGISLDILTPIVPNSTEVFGSLRAFSCGNFDDKLLSLLSKHCPQLELLRIVWPALGVGRKCYRTLAHVLTKMHNLRSLDVGDTAERTHKWRLAFMEKLARNGGGKNLEFLNLMIDMPFDPFLRLIKNCKKLTRLNCFTIKDFHLGSTLHVLDSTQPHRQSDKCPGANRFVVRPNRNRDPLPPAPQLLVGIVNKSEFREVFRPMEVGGECPPGTMHFQPYTLANPVDWELRKVV